MLRQQTWWDEQTATVRFTLSSISHPESGQWECEEQKWCYSIPPALIQIKTTHMATRSRVQLGLASKRNPVRPASIRWMTGTELQTGPAQPQTPLGPAWIKRWRPLACSSLIGAAGWWQQPINNWASASLEKNTLTWAGGMQRWDTAAGRAAQGTVNKGRPDRFLLFYFYELGGKRNRQGWQVFTWMPLLVILCVSSSGDRRCEVILKWPLGSPSSGYSWQGAFQPTGDILNKNNEINGNILAMCYLYRFYIHNWNAKLDSSQVTHILSCHYSTV